MDTYSGIVQKGQLRGKQLGYPTANIPLTDSTLSGIYIARVFYNEQRYKAAVFVDKKRKVLETYFLDFAGDLYGKRIRVELMKKIRESEDFSNDFGLTLRIAKDIEAVRQYFSESDDV